MEDKAKPETAQCSDELSDVLIVSTRPERLKTLMRALKASWGWVVVASSLRLAKEALSLQSFGIVFCEESLPDGSYRELLSTDKVKFVLLRRSGDSPKYLEAMQRRAFDVLRSPLQPAEVERVLRRATTDLATPRKSPPMTKIVAATLIL
jgi:DNA-binding NtrC family response regulator